MQASLGIDVGSVSTKGVIIDDEGRLLAGDYLETNGDPLAAVNRLLSSLRGQILGKVNITSVGTTGSARKLIGVMLGANAIKNEITAHAIGALHRRPNLRTILEIGGQDSKIILLSSGVVTDYAMNTICAAGTGAFLSSQALRMGISVKEVGAGALRSEKPAKIAARCTVFAESDLIHKAQAGHTKDDLLAGLCRAVVLNYLNNVAKGKQIHQPVVFQGGVSKNIGVVRAFESELGCKIHLDSDSHLMGAIGSAILAKRAGNIHPFDFAVMDIPHKTRVTQCGGCANNCEVVSFYQGERMIDWWGAKCERGRVSA